MNDLVARLKSRIGKELHLTKDEADGLFARIEQLEALLSAVLSLLPATEITDQARQALASRDEPKP